MREITSGLQFPEGPVALADGSVVVVEIKRGTLTRVAPDGKQTIVATTGGGPNGAAIGPDGLVYVCNNGGFEWHDVGGLLVPGNQAHDYSGGRIQRVDLATGKVEDLYTACAGRAPALRRRDVDRPRLVLGARRAGRGRRRPRLRPRRRHSPGRAPGLPALRLARRRRRRQRLRRDARDRRHHGDLARRRGDRAGADRGPAHHQYLLRRPRAPHRVRHGLRHRAAARHRVATAGPSPRVPMTRLAVALLCLALSPALVSAQDSLWEKYMAAGAESYGKGQLAEAEK